MNFTPKINSLVIILFLISSSLFSQELVECGFEYTPEAQQYYESIEEDVKRLERQFLDEQQTGRSSTVLNSVPIKAHIINRSNGTGGLSFNELTDALDIMNSIYIPAGIEFFLCSEVNYIDDDEYYDYVTNEENALTSTNNVDGVINIYFTESISTTSGGGLCGYAYFPGGPETILMANGCTTNGSTLSHEMGHFFALPHTHGSSNTPGSTEELVDGSNCDSTGDNICDTPADPQLGSSNVNSSCVYTGNALDANNDFYEPDAENLMSYSRKECRSLFSRQQYARINAIYRVSRGAMECPSFNTDFTVDYNGSCETDLTVNFTSSGVGATEWSWDVDGDDIEDYTTENVTHTYNSFGNYDVALTVSNGRSAINKVKTEYINVSAQEISTSTISLNLQLDNWPAETSWEFVDADNNALYSGGPYIEGTDDFTTIEATFDVNDGACYSFVIYDSFGDGICCDSGSGNYRLRAEDNTILANGSDFYGGKRDNFVNGVLSVADFAKQNLSLFPNPSRSSITINSPTLPDSYSIYNTLGQVLKQSKINSVNDLKVNIETLTDGMYFLKLSKDSASQVLSFIKN